MKKLKYRLRNYTSKKHTGKRRDHKSNQRQEKHKQTVVNADINMSQQSALHLAKPATLVTERITMQRFARAVDGQKSNGKYKVLNVTQKVMMICA